MYLHRSNRTDCQAHGWLPVAMPSPPPQAHTSFLLLLLAVLEVIQEKPEPKDQQLLQDHGQQQQPYVRHVRWKTLSQMVFHHAHWFLTLFRFSHLPVQPAHTLAHDGTILRHGPKRSAEPRPDVLNMLWSLCCSLTRGPKWILKWLQFRHLNW